MKVKPGKYWTLHHFDAVWCRDGSPCWLDARFDTCKVCGYRRGEVQHLRWWQKQPKAAGRREWIGPY